MIYMDAAITQMYQNYENYDFEYYFQQFQKLFENKDITVVCGENVLNNIQYNALTICNSVEYIYAPSKDAYSQYDEILKKFWKQIKTYYLYYSRPYCKSAGL